MLSAAAVVVCALDLLGRSSAAAPIQFLTSPPPAVSPNAEAILVRNPTTIYLITSTATFRNAQRGMREDCVKIASIIAHEEWHIRHGGDEQGAYIAQIMTLMWLRAEAKMITSVRQSMAVAVGRQRRAAPTGRLMALGDVGPAGAVP